MCLVLKPCDTYSINTTLFIIAKRVTASPLFSRPVEKAKTDLRQPKYIDNMPYIILQQHRASNPSD